jgi:5-formyltetrahydrofolate cyclo-ligase
MKFTPLDKPRLRREFRARRAAITPRSRAAASGALSDRLLQCEKLLPESRVIAVYLALPHELSLVPFIEAALKRGHTLVAPAGDGFARLSRLNDLSPDRRSIAQPDGEDFPTGDIDIFLVPGLAFDGSGVRLGQGGGWYDRVLAMRKGDALCMGIAFEEQIASALPRESHDIFMDYIVTPARCICCSTVEIDRTSLSIKERHVR